MRAPGIDYTTEIGEEIATRLAGGESLMSICSDEHMPARRSILRWVVQPNHPIRELYFNGRTAQGFACADDVVELVSEIRSGRVDHQSARVMADSLKWASEIMAGRWHRRASAVDHTSSDGSMSAPTRIEIVAPGHDDDGPD